MTRNDGAVELTIDPMSAGQDWPIGHLQLEAGTRGRECNLSAKQRHNNDVV